MDLSQVDGVSAILAALAAYGGAGAGAGVSEVARDAVTGARDKLVDMMRRRFDRRFGKGSVADARLTVYAADPTDANAQALRDDIVSAGLDLDEELVATAREVLQHAGPSALGPGSIAGEIITSINTGPGHSHIGGVQYYRAPTADPQ